MIQESDHRLLHQSIDESETILAAIVRVGYVIVIRIRVVLHQGLDLLGRAAKIEKIPDVLLIHADEKAVMRKIRHGHLA